MSNLPPKLHLKEASLRDDLHKGAPVSGKWRKVMETCGRDADWDTTGKARAQAALDQDLSKGFAKPIMKALKDTLQTPTLFGKRDLLDRFAASNELSGQERRLVDHLTRHSEATPSSEALRGAMADTIREHLRATFREMEGHLIRKAAWRDLAKMGRRLQDCMGALPIDRIADSFISGTRDPQSGRPAPLDIDEDLRRA